MIKRHLENIMNRKHSKTTVVPANRPGLFFLLHGGSLAIPGRFLEVIGTRPKCRLPLPFIKLIDWPVNCAELEVRRCVSDKATSCVHFFEPCACNRPPVVPAFGVIGGSKLRRNPKQESCCFRQSVLMIILVTNIKPNKKS